MVRKLTDVVAERVMEARRPGSESVTEVRVLVGRPIPEPDPDGDWICPVQIIGLGDEGVANVYGIDAVQALLLALQKVGVDLTAAARSGVELRWLESPNLGFPLTHPDGPLPPA